MKNRQIRSAPTQFRAVNENDTMKICGYFAVFNSNYEVWPGATESIDPGAFEGALDGDIRCLADHDTRIVLGRTKNGTLTLRTDEKGLYGEVVINQADTEAVNLYERVRRGDVDQCSFGFGILDQEEVCKGGEIHWTIKKVELYEVSVVTFPAYEETSVEARKKDFEQVKKREFVRWKEQTKKRLKGE